MTTTATLNEASIIKSEALTNLRVWLKPGDTVYTILRHVSGSGTTRHITPVAFIGEGGPDSLRYLTYNIHKVLGYTLTKDRDALVSRGCGMDMGYEIVYNLGRVLFSGVNKGMVDGDGGYALKHRWL
jgi:hypothetical protein